MRAAEEEMRQRCAAEALETEEKKRWTDIIRWIGGLPERFRDASFDGFRVCEQNRRALETAREYAEAVTEPREGLIFMGEPGRGKTHLAAAVAVTRIRRGKSVVFGTVPMLLGSVKATYNESATTSEQQVIGFMTACSLLVLDDLGKERPSEWVEEKLYEIIDTRYARKLPIIITTNAGLEQIERRYAWNGPAIVSRLYQMCKGVMVGGPDWRRK
jgi:DNA replication protein DnaC